MQRELLIKNNRIVFSLNAKNGAIFGFYADLLVSAIYYFYYLFTETVLLMRLNRVALCQQLTGGGGGSTWGSGGNRMAKDGIRSVGCRGPTSNFCVIEYEVLLCSVACCRRILTSPQVSLLVHT